MVGGDCNRLTRCYARTAPGPERPGRSGRHGGVSGPRSDTQVDPERPLQQAAVTPWLHHCSVRGPCRLPSSGEMGWRRRTITPPRLPFRLHEERHATLPSQ